MLALLAIVYLQRVIVAGHNRKLAGVVKVERGDSSFGVVRSEALERAGQKDPTQGYRRPTLDGRKLEMTSLIFCVGGPAAEGVAEPAAIFGEERVRLPRWAHVE